MHFIFLTLGYHQDAVGGAYRYVTEVAERLARKHLVDVITPNPGNELPAREDRAEVEIYRYPNASGFFWQNWHDENRSATALLQELLSESAVPVLVVTCHAYFEPTQLASPRPGVFLFTGPWAEEYRFARQAEPRSWFRKRFDGLIGRRMHRTEEAALRRARRILTISHYYQSQLSRWHPVELPPLKMISAGVDSARFAPVADRPAVRKRLGVLPDDFLFLAVRRLDPRMGLIELIEGFAQASADFPRARLWIAGKGPQRAELQARLEALKIAERIRLLGYVAEPELAAYFNAADCTVMPSLDLEGFGLATVESLACGTPVIGSDAGANPELIGSLGTQLLFPPASAAAVAAKMKEVLANPGILPGRDRCREYAVTNYSWDAVASAFEGTFTELFESV